MEVIIHNSSILKIHANNTHFSDCGVWKCWNNLRGLIPQMWYDEKGRFSKMLQIVAWKEDIDRIQEGSWK